MRQLLFFLAASVCCAQGLIVWEGDSITDPTHNPPAANQMYPALSLALISPTPTSHITAVTGSSLGQLESRMTTDDAYYNSGNTYNILTLLIGANDLQDGGATAAVFVARLKTDCLLFRASGYRILLMTVLPQSSSSFNIRRNTVNAAIKADPSFYDYLADIGGDSTIGPDSAGGSTTYYSDGVHPTAASHAVIAPIVLAGINTLIAHRDPYGGDTAIPGTATGNWHTQKISGRWWFVTPLGNALHFVAPINFNFPRNATTYAKYATNSDRYNCDVMPSYVPRMKAWGFTGIGGENSDIYLTPAFGYSGSCWPTVDGFQPQAVRLPYVLYLQSSSKAVFAKTKTGALDQPIHGWRHTINSRLGSNGYLTAASEAEADIYDSRFYTSFNDALLNDNSMAFYWASPADLKRYLMGIKIDEADGTFSFTTGGDNCPSDYPTTLGVCTGKEHLHGGLQVARVSPIQTANRMALSIYPDSKIYVKAVGWRNYLKAKYGSISSMNAAWGSTYSSCDMEGAGDQFGSCGSKITGESFGTGDGSSAAYTHTLAQLTPSWFSVAVYVAGTMIAGDMGYCGWNVSSSLDCQASGVFTDTSTAPPSTSKFFGPLIDIDNTSISYTTGATTIKVKAGSVGIVAISGNGTTVTVRTGSVDQYVMKQHGTWPGAHVTISGTSNYNISGVVASVVDSFTFTITNPATGTAEANGTAGFTDAFLPNGSAITISYVKNGWGVGNGVMDEDGRNTWMGNQVDETEGKTLHLLTAPVRTDLEGLLSSMATTYFSGMNTVFSANFGSGSSRTVLNLGIEPLMYWGSPSHAGVLAAAGAYTDVLQIQTHWAGLSQAEGVQTVMTQERLDWIRQNAGDVPLLNLDFIVAQPDSAMRDSGFSLDWTHFTTQSARGAGYYAIHLPLQLFAYTTGGSKPFIGSELYMWTDNTNESTNYGIVSQLDNAYDGHESTTSPVACSAPSSALVCGGETYVSGDFVTGAKAANALWRLAGSPPPVTGSQWSGRFRGKLNTPIVPTVPGIVSGNVLTCGGTSPFTCLLPNPVVAGNMIWVGSVVVGDPSATVTDSQGNTYTLVYDDTGRGNRQYVATASSSGALTITFTRSGSVNGVIVAEYGGINIGAGFDGSSPDGGGPAGASQQRVANGTALNVSHTGDIVICSVRDYDATSVTPTDGVWSTGDALVFRAGFHELTALFDTVTTVTTTGATGYYIGAGNTSAGGCTVWKSL